MNFYGVPKEVLKWLFAVMNERSRIAASTTTRFSDAVVCFYAYDLKRPFDRARPTQFGSGVLLGLNNNYFILSAAHCFEPYEGWAIVVGLGNKLHYLPGERCSSARGPSGAHDDDPIDAAVFHIHGDVDPELKAASLKLDDLDFNSDSKQRDFHVALGFCTKNSKYVDGHPVSEQSVFTFGEYGDKEYKELELERRKHVALTWEKEVMVNAVFQNSPSPRGMSGGAILRINGLKFDPVTPPENLDAKLVAILIECKETKQVKPAAVVGTRINYHIGLISRFSPEMDEWIRQQYVTKGPGL